MKQTGFENIFSTEAVSGSLPIGRNSPQVCPNGLYAEQINGTSFTQPRRVNFRSWLYKIQPSVTHLPFKKCSSEQFKYIDNNFGCPESFFIDPNQKRWLPVPLPTSEESVTFVEGLVTHAGTGSPIDKAGIAIYHYRCNKSMDTSAFYNSDGDFLIVPQVGTLSIITENGKLVVPPKYIAIIPRGIKFAVHVSEASRGYACEIFDGHFQLPDLGPIGSNGLANSRDFEAPVAFYETTKAQFTVLFLLTSRFTTSSAGRCSSARWTTAPSTLWPGSLPTYQGMATILPTAITSSTSTQSEQSRSTIPIPPSSPSLPPRPIIQGLLLPYFSTALCDFVIFPERWMVAENTFRPPYYHRNTMNEYMGNIVGAYDAKEKGFVPGASSLHLCMTAHGPDSEAFEKASNAELQPAKYKGALAFMFESYLLFKISVKSQDLIKVDTEYYKCWQKLTDKFSSTVKKE
jgi:homogentisate 1,2-dioxygenase